MESILNTEKGVCFACGAHTKTEKHHIFEGVALRPISERLGLWVYLCPVCHRGTDGVHGREGDRLNRQLKDTAQRLWERDHSHDEWMAIFGRNYKK